MYQSQIQFSKTTSKILDQARGHAARRQAPSTAPDHLLLALLDMKGNQALEIVETLNIDARQLRRTLAEHLPEEDSNVQTAPTLHEETEQILRYSMREAEHLGHSEVSAAHLLMGLLYERNGVTHDLLTEAGLTVYEVRQYILSHPKKFKTRSLPQVSGFPPPSPLFFIPLGTMIACGAALYLQLGGERLVQPFTILFVVSGWITSLCLHEFGHALAAYIGGDQSVREAGYLTLNPFKYTHPFLSIILPVIIMLLGGIGLPGGAVYTNPLALRNQGWRSLVSAAGPLGTIAFSVLIMWPFVFGLGAATNWYPLPFWGALAFLGLLQVTALFFNLLPVPPLDGFGIIAPFLPHDISMQAYRFGNLLFFLLLFIFWQGGPITQTFWSEVFGVTQSLGIPPPLISLGMQQFGF